MNQTLRPQPLLAEVLPGALTLALLLLLVYDHTPKAFDYLCTPSTGPGALALLGAVFLFAAWIVGTLLDTIRNGVVEEVVDWFSKRPLNWEFFVRGDREKVTQLDEYFFAYYQAKVNYTVGAVIFIGACLFWWPTGTVARIAFFPAAPLIALFCAIDSRSLRREIKKLAEEPHRPVHAGVYTRLQKATHGIGVFAIRDIPANINVFAGDTNEIHDIDESELIGVEPEIKQLYDDFCVRKGGKLKGPSNFNNLTVAWYLNHSSTPNIRCDENFDFISTRIIKQGEELTADYTTYDENPLNFTPCTAPS